MPFLFVDRTYAVECSNPHNLMIYCRITRLVMIDELRSYKLNCVTPT